jgi:hypothetical protein
MLDTPPIFVTKVSRYYLEWHSALLASPRRPGIFVTDECHDTPVPRL